MSDTEIGAKTEVKLRVSDEHGSLGESLSQSQVQEQTVVCRTKPRSPDALKKILADPEASEEEWLAAAHELEQHEKSGASSKSPTPKASRRKIAVALILTPLLLICLTECQLFGWMTALYRDMAPAVNNPPPAAPTDDWVQDGVDFSPFMTNMQKQIKHEWNPPRQAQNDRIQVTFNVDQKGNVHKLKLLSGSQSKEANLAALDAVTKASPFPHLPGGSPDDVDIEFTFDYNVLADDGAAK